MTRGNKFIFSCSKRPKYSDGSLPEELTLSVHQLLKQLEPAEKPVTEMVEAEEKDRDRFVVHI